MVSPLSANTILMTKVMAVRDISEQHSQLYLASSHIFASYPRFRATTVARGGHILPGRGMSPTRATAVSLIGEAGEVFFQLF